MPKDVISADTALAAGDDPRAFPATNAVYAAVPPASLAVVTGLKSAKSIKLIGVGHSTLDTVLYLAAHLPAKVDISYITHMVDDHAHLQTIVDHNVRLLAATTQDKLDGISPSLAIQLHFIPLDAVPHTNADLADCEKDYAGFMQTPNGKTAQRIVESDKPFAFVVINAGFEIGADKAYQPYTEIEAAAQGRMLGIELATGTNLIAVHGGPRNLRDETPSAEKGDTHTGQRTMEAFTDAFAEAQQASGAAPLIVAERFAPGLSYNAVKAGYILGRKQNCAAFISNSEGYGTMDGAIRHISNQDRLLGMFPFASQYLDPTGQRQANIEKYNKWGIVILGPQGSFSLAKQHLERETTPNRRHDGAAVILATLGLAQPQVMGAEPNTSKSGASHRLRPDGRAP